MTSENTVNVESLKDDFKDVYGSVPTTMEEDKKIAAEAAARKYHIVKKGDTLGRIAINNHTTVKKLCQLNGIRENSILRLGQRIRVR